MALVLALQGVHAQKFEGSITWAVHYMSNNTAEKEDGMNLMLPSSLTLQTNNLDYIMTTEGGILPVEMLWMGDKNKYYRINRSAKTYTLLPADAGASILPDSLRPVVVKTTETDLILGYHCTKYTIHFSTDTSIHQTYWTTTEISLPNLRTLPGQSGQAMYYEGLNGLPLKMEFLSPQMKMVTAVTSIKKELLPAAVFTIPADFKPEKNF